MRNFLSLVWISLFLLVSVTAPALPAATAPAAGKKDQADLKAQEPKKAGRLYAIRQGGKMGYMNEDGRVVVPAKFDYASAMQEGYGTVVIGQKTGLIDREGRFVIEPKYRCDGGLDSVQEGLVRVMTDEGLYGF